MVLPYECAPSRTNSPRIIRALKGGEKPAEAFAGARWLGRRGANDSIETNRASGNEVFDAIQRIRQRDLEEAFPVPKHLEQRDLPRAESLVAAARARTATDETDTPGIPGRSAGNRDRLQTGDLCGESERQGRAHLTRAATGLVDDLLDETLRRWWGHPEARGGAPPVEASAHPAYLARARQTRQSLRDCLRRAGEILGAPEAVARSKDLRSDSSGDIGRLHGWHPSRCRQHVTRS